MHIDLMGIPGWLRFTPAREHVKFAPTARQGVRVVCSGQEWKGKGEGKHGRGHKAKQWKKGMKEKEGKEIEIGERPRETMKEGE